MVGALERKEADIVVAQLSSNFERSQVADFTRPLYVEYTGLVIANPDAGPNIWAYLIIFTFEIWMIILSVCLLLAFAYQLQSKALLQPLHHYDDSESWGITNSISLVAMSLAQLEYPIFAHGKSVKILHVCTCLYAYLLFTMYTADLTSRLTVLPGQASFTSMQEALDNDYKIVLIEGSVSEIIFSSAVPGTSYHQAWHEVIRPNPYLLTKNIKDARDLALTDKHAYYASEPSSDPRYM